MNDITENFAIARGRMHARRNRKKYEGGGKDRITYHRENQARRGTNKTGGASGRGQMG